MSAQGDCEFLVQRARELVQHDLWAAKAWLITARSLYPADFNIQVRSGPCTRLPQWRCSTWPLRGYTGRQLFPPWGPSPPVRPAPLALFPLLSTSPAPLSDTPHTPSPPRDQHLEIQRTRWRSGWPEALGVFCFPVAGSAPHRLWERPSSRSFIMAAICVVPTNFETLFLQSWGPKDCK